MAILYSAADAEETSNETSPEEAPSDPDSIVCSLEGCTGIPQDHQLTPQILELSKDQSLLSSYLKQAATERRPIVVPLEGQMQDIMRDIREYILSQVWEFFLIIGLQ
jgi:hypothetical protein